MSVQMLWDLTAASASAVAAVFIFTRRRMLSGDHGRWYTAHGYIQGALACQAIWMGAVAISILAGAHVNQRETVGYLISAAVAVAFTVNLDRTGKVGAGS